ncbi:hypothetical protein AKJ09_03079 [Labilithrix luteola]|uniref:Glycosyltransferase RgtA/B/C/D-like domain-containing protein n=1 Tax=Labilithrix luteola TaxID=1391654 RepID=A0A0K1PS98_9BACT|nr:hypothetical protein AKJ09_03079 [Labilithrix luteola]
MRDERGLTTKRVRPAASVDALFAFGLFVVALALRLAAAFTLAAEPVWDGQYYDFGAKRIAAGFGYSDDRMIDGHAVWHPWCHYPVGYSGYLAAFYKFFGATPVAAHVANGVCGALLAVVTYLLAREALSPRRARAAGVLVAVHPGLVLYGALAMTEPLSALLVLAAFWTSIRVRRSHWGLASKLPSWLLSLRGPAAGALVLGLSALVRPQGLLCAPILGLAYGVPGEVEAHARWQSLRRFVVGGVVASLVALVPVLPWTARNCRVMDGCAFVSTNAGWNLAIGAFPRATGRFETLRSSDGCREVTGQVQQDRCWLAYGLSHIRSAPLRWLGLVPAKLSYTFDHESFAVEYLHEARPAAWPEPRRTRARELLTSLHRLLVVFATFAFVGLVVPGRGKPREMRRAAIAQGVVFASLGIGAYLAFAEGTPTFWPLVLVSCVLPWLPIPGRPALPPAIAMGVVLLATTVLTHAVFFGEDRYHMVVTPVLCLLAAAAFRAPAFSPKNTPEYTNGANTELGGRAVESAQAQAE